MLIFGSGIAASLTKIMTASFSFSREATQDTSQMGMYLARAAVEVAEGILPFLILLFVSAIAGSVALGGWLFSTKALAPKFSRMDPIKGLAKMFSLKSLVELIKAIAKVSLVVAVAVLIIHSQLPTLIGLADQNVISAMETASKILGWGFFYLACTMIVIAMIDVPFQIFDHTKNLKMTKQEVKDEFKDTEGKPEVKRKIRQLQMEMAQRRMMQDVPQADVVITNPTHFSVALRYKPEEDAAPILLAKGHDQVALKIREIANEHDVEIVEAPPLARSVYHHAEIGQEIPS
ncbi:flagellar biosynthesis protein FlhB, partial [Oleiphilus sp. HI0086]|uniref:flagellar biosynthesis protein FlhB n=1 Tax=Oleiphilus sp. HI0086 TaxID=1822260 RepID=UPI0009EE080A